MVLSINNQRPIYLFLIILPDNIGNWLEYNEQYIILNSTGYWYIHPDNTELSENDNTQTINIPENQIINLETIDNLLEKIYN